MRGTKLLVTIAMLSPLASTACGADSGSDDGSSSSTGATYGVGGTATGGTTTTGGTTGVTGGTGTGASSSGGTGTGGVGTGGVGTGATSSGGAGTGGTVSTPVDCTAIGQHDGWELCESGTDFCAAVFTDGAGCDAVCAAAGLACSETWENAEDSCAPDTGLGQLSCGAPSGHQSDYCLCVGTGGAGSGGTSSGGTGGTSTGGVSSGGTGGVSTGGTSSGGTGGVSTGGTSSGGTGGTSTGGTSSGGTGGTSTGGTGGGGNDCNTPPAASPLVGWASVNGEGVATTTGGGNATPTVVTTLSQLQNAVKGTNAAVIYVKGILAPGDIAVGSNKTIVGLCGAEIHGHLELKGSVNVIVRNIAIVGYGSGNCALDPAYDSSVGCSSGADAITVQKDAHHIWFDHCDVSDGTDGNLDITNGANFITISWTKFHYKPRTDNQGDDSTGAAGHRFSNLVGGTDNPSDDTPTALNVTWHHNWWADNVVERQPRIRFGQNHLFNNLYSSDTTNYCVRAGKEANILLQGNYFDGVDSPHEFNNSTDQGTAYITADSSNTYANTTGTKATGGGGTPFTNPPYAYTAESAAAARTAVMAGAGPH